MFGFLKDVLSSDTQLKDVALDERSELARTMIELFVEAANVDDAGIDQEEGHIIAHIMATHFEIEEAALDKMFDEALAAADERVQMHGLAKKLRDMTDYDERVAMIELTWMVVLADDHLDHMEASLMRRLAGLLYVDDVDSGKAAKAARARLTLAP